MKKTGFIFTDSPDRTGLIVNIPNGIRSKTILLETMGTGLRFPDYYGVNWDAFEECIRDLSWLPEHDVSIRHVDIPLASETSSAKTYLAILMDAVRKWQHESSHRLMVIFPSGLQATIEKLVDQE